MIGWVSDTDVVSRLTLMQHEEHDQNDRDLHGDISGTRSVEFRNIFGSL